MPNKNEVIIMGHLGRNPELRRTPNGTSVCSFSVATTEKYNDKESTEWHNVVVWKDQAEQCEQLLSKGDGVVIVGKLNTRTWDDNDGAKRVRTEIVAFTVAKWVGSIAKQTQTTNSGQGEPKQQSAFDAPEDDLPF